MKCDECGRLLDSGVCPNCGLVSPEWQEVDDKVPIYEMDSKKKRHGSPRENKIVDMSVMTCCDPSETKNTDLKRALKLDGYFGWEVQRSMILNKEIKYIINKLGLGALFLDDCYYYLRKIKDKVNFTGRSLEEIAPALVYVFSRLNGQPVYLLDFRNLGYDDKNIYRIYMKLVKDLDLNIKPQNPIPFVRKAVDHMYYFPEEDYRKRFEIISTITKKFVMILDASKANSHIDLTNTGLPLVGALFYMHTKNYPDLEVTQKEIAEVCGITAVTLRKYIQKL